MKKMKLKPWVKDLVFGIYFGIMICLIIIFGFGV